MRKLIRNIARTHVAKEGIQHANKRKASGDSIFAENWREYAREQIREFEAKKKAANSNREYTTNNKHRQRAKNLLQQFRTRQ